MQYDARKEKIETTEPLGKKNYKDTIKKYMTTWKETISRSRKAESRSTRRMGTDIFTKGELLKCLSTWHFMQERGDGPWTGGLHGDGDNKTAPSGKMYEIRRCHQDRLWGQEESHSSWKILNFSLLEQARCGTKERDQKLQGDGAHVGAVEVVCYL